MKTLAKVIVITATIYVWLSCFLMPQPPDYARRIAPPVEYRQWHAELMECTHPARSNFDRVNWFIVYGEAWWNEESRRYISGKWYWPHDIVLSEPYRMSPTLVKHELLHDLIGRPGHDHIWFLECLI